MKLGELRGLQSTDRTPQEQKAINQVMGYQQEEDDTSWLESLWKPIKNAITPTLAQDAVVQYATDPTKRSRFNTALATNNDRYGVGRNSFNAVAQDRISKIANEVSSSYKAYNGTDKLPLTNNDYKTLASGYDSVLKVSGEDAANRWLDRRIEDKVAENQSWLEQAWHGVSHLIPAIEGGFIQTVGMLMEMQDPFGIVDNAIHSARNTLRDRSVDEVGRSQDLNWWDDWMNRIIDNPLTRYGRDLEHAGASHVSDVLKLVGLSDMTADERIAATKATATKYNPEGIGADAIHTTEEQNQSLVNSATPWTALQSGGFTALSMMTGAGEAKVAQSVFGGLAKGAVWLNKSGKALETFSKLKTALKGIKAAQKFVDMTIIPGLVGSAEGVMEGLNTKIETEREGREQLDNYYQEKVKEEAERLKISGIAKTDEDAENLAIAKYSDEYDDALRQIEWASSKAGIHNFYLNSLINGMMNTTLKAGLMAPRVQETLRNSKMFGWAYRKPKFRIDADGVVTAKTPGKMGTALKLIGEPFGEGFEEYAQNITGDVFSKAAGNNINEFIKNRFDPNGAVAVTDTFGSDYAAAWTALEESLTSKESIESAILGAVSSSMGTVSGVGRGYHRDEKTGKVVRNSILDPRNFTRGLNSKGELETKAAYINRMLPWRSSILDKYVKMQDDRAEAEETAFTLTEWLKDKRNKGKWDGLVGTANWLRQMQDAAESNDQFSYRTAQMGKAINDVFMLSHLRGTDFYDSVMEDLHRAADGDISDSDIQKLRQGGGEEYQNVTDKAIVEKVQSNANKMLGLMSSIEEKGRSLDGMLGRIDNDTKQSLIFGELMEEDFSERKDEIGEWLRGIKNKIVNSRESSGLNLTEEQKALIAKYGSLANADKAEAAVLAEKEKTEKIIKELEAIDKKNLSDKQKETLKARKEYLKNLNKGLEAFDALYKKDENGKRTQEKDADLFYAVLNEEEIMSLDPVTRKEVLLRGATRFYNATHLNREKVDQLELELDALNQQISTIEEQKKKWTTPDGKVRKHYNKQYQKANEKLAQLQKEKTSRLRELDAAKGTTPTKPAYSEAQQAVIDNLVRQGVAIAGDDFVDKVVDMGRLEQAIDSYHKSYIDVMSDPNAFQRFVRKAEQTARLDLARMRAERVADIEDFQEFSQEWDKMDANASEEEARVINAVMREHSARKRAQVAEEQGEEAAAAVRTNYDRYVDNLKKQRVLVAQLPKKTNLTDNDISLLIDAMQYLSSKGVDVDDREAAVSALLEEDEEGHQGGKFRQWVEDKNASVSPQQRTFMPVFSTIGQVVGDYVDLLKSAQEEEIIKGNIHPEVVIATPEGAATASAPKTTAPVETPPPAEQKKSIFEIAGTPTSSGEDTVGPEATPTTDAQTKSMKERQDKEKASESKTARQASFEKVTTPDIASAVDASAGIIDTSNESDAAKELATQHLDNLAVNEDETYNTVDDVLTALQGQVEALREEAEMQEDKEKKKAMNGAAGLLDGVYDSLQNKKTRGGGVIVRTKRPTSTVPEGKDSSVIRTADLFEMQRRNPDAWPLVFTARHGIDAYNLEHQYDGNTPVYFITDSEWSGESARTMNNYDTLTNMPVVIAVEVEAPQDPDNTTALEVNGHWYQPIGILPSTGANRRGSNNTRAIRELASKEQGRHLVTQDGTPTGAPLVTRVAGVNYLGAHYPGTGDEKKRDNSPENNKRLSDIVLSEIDKKDTAEADREADRLRGMEKSERILQPSYQEQVQKFVGGLKWHNADDRKHPNSITFTPDPHREGGAPSPITVYPIPMNETTARESDKTLPEVLAEGSADDVITFNSRTDRAFKRIRRYFLYILGLDPKDLSAHFDESKDKCKKEAERLKKDITNTLRDYIYFSEDDAWSLRVTYKEDDKKYSIYFYNKDTKEKKVLGEIREIKKDDDPVIGIKEAKNFFKNFLVEGLKLTTPLGNPFLKWQTPAIDLRNFTNSDTSVADKAKGNWEDIVTDGILTMAGESLTFESDWVEINNPISKDGAGNIKFVYGQPTVANRDNASPPPPMDVTPQAEGAVETKDGAQIQEDSGIPLDDTPQEERKAPGQDKYEDAKKTVDDITKQSRKFILDKNEAYYYIVNEKTRERIKYLRVTTLIAAADVLPEYTEEEARKKHAKQYVYKPTLREIYDKLRESHALPELSDAQLVTFTSTEKMAEDLNIPVKDIQKAVADLRTEHKHTKYGAWGTPSTAIGNTMDEITRDFFSGKNPLEIKYPNVSREGIQRMVKQLEEFKNSLDAKGIHIVSENIMAYGTMTVKEKDGTEHTVNVAGTLDLLGYDEEGNFYIFDMKTTHSHSTNKLQEEKDKWARQLVMYASLLKQTYGIDIPLENLKIIPINVNYDDPEVWNKRENRAIPVLDYREVDGQLQKSPHGEDKFEDYIMETPKEEKEPNGDNTLGMRRTAFEDQFAPVTNQNSKFGIRWDYLSGEDQAIADALVDEVDMQKADEGDTSPETTPVSATIETPVGESPAFMATGDEEAHTLNISPADAPAVSKTSLDKIPWYKLSPGQRSRLSDCGIDTKEQYNKEDIDIINSILDCS